MANRNNYLLNAAKLMVAEEENRYLKTDILKLKAEINLLENEIASHRLGIGPAETSSLMGHLDPPWIVVKNNNEGKHPGEILSYRGLITEGIKKVAVPCDGRTLDLRWPCYTGLVNIMKTDIYTVPNLIGYKPR